MVTWFIVDVIILIPFELINRDLRLLKLFLLLKIAKLIDFFRYTRIIKLFSVFKESKFIHSNILRMGVGFDRFIYLMLVYLLFMHILTCVW